MKHIKTYKLFENNSQLSPEEICEEIENILIDLDAIHLKVDAWPIYEVDQTYLKIVILTEPEDADIDFSVEEFSDNFKQLFSQLDDWGWTPMGKEDSLITTTPAKQKVSNLASHVEITDYDFVCPNPEGRLENGEWVPCESDETSEQDPDNEVCDKCGYVGHPDEFVVSIKKFGTLKELLFLIQRRLDKIQICFIRE